MIPKYRRRGRQKQKWQAKRSCFLGLVLVLGIDFLFCRGEQSRKESGRRETIGLPVLSSRWLCSTYLIRKLFIPPPLSSLPCLPPNTTITITTNIHPSKNNLRIKSGYWAREIEVYKEEDSRACKHCRAMSMLITHLGPRAPPVGLFVRPSYHLTILSCWCWYLRTSERYLGLKHP